MNPPPSIDSGNDCPSRWLVVFCLVFAGEMIFSLPFHVPRYFRPTVLEVFGLSNSQLGDVFAVYGIIAMLCYFPGGAIADRCSTRKLLSLSLFATALGGFYLARIPAVNGLSMLFAYWGLTSILLFWAALIRATREWGGMFAQGRAFGILDGGRGLVAAGIATLAVWLFSLSLPPDLDTSSEMQRRYAMQGVIYFYTLITTATGFLVWFFIPDAAKDSGNHRAPFEGMRCVLSERAVWLQALIVVCAYCGYKGLDNYSLYAVEVLGMNEVDSARFTSMAAYLRPVAAITAGFLADRWLASRIIGVAFLFLVLSYTMLVVQSPRVGMIDLIYANLLITCIAVFALRGVYFALLEETEVDRGLTGTAVGLISLAGFTPDIFFGPISGRLLDHAPGLAGHRNFFALLVLISLIGMLSSLLLASRERPG